MREVISPSTDLQTLSSGAGSQRPLAVNARAVSRPSETGRLWSSGLSWLRRGRSETSGSVDPNPREPRWRRTRGATERSTQGTKRQLHGGRLLRREPMESDASASGGLFDRQRRDDRSRRGEELPDPGLERCSISTARGQDAVLMAMAVMRVLPFRSGDRGQAFIPGVGVGVVTADAFAFARVNELAIERADGMAHQQEVRGACKLTRDQQARQGCSRAPPRSRRCSPVGPSHGCPGAASQPHLIDADPN